MDEEFPRRRHILSQHDVPDAKRDKQGLKNLALGRRNLHVWKTIHVSGIINEDHNSRKRRVIVRRNFNRQRSSRYSFRYKYSKHASSLNGRRNDISRGKKHFSSLEEAQICHFASSIVGQSRNFTFSICIKKKKEKRKRFV